MSAMDEFRVRFEKIGREGLSDPQSRNQAFSRVGVIQSGCRKMSSSE